MQYLSHAMRLCAFIPLLMTVTGCAGDTEYARNIMHGQAVDECRKLTDSNAYLDCKKRANQMHARR